MANISENIQNYLEELKPYGAALVAVSKTKPIEDLQEAYDSGQRILGENKVQELVSKEEVLPKDIEWHMIGHLQSNKVKYIAPFVSLIHAVDSLKLLKEINKQARKNDRVIDCLIQIHIAKEEAKFGLSFEEADELFGQIAEFEHVKVVGLMGMATNTDDSERVRGEFRGLKEYFDLKKEQHNLQELSIGMSGDYKIALEEGSTMVRIGSAIFGQRAISLKP